MAKLKKSVMTLLEQIVSAAAANQTFFVDHAEDAIALLEHNPPLIQVNKDNLDHTGTKAAARPTDAGNVMIANTKADTGGSTTGEAAATSPYQVMNGIELPKSKPRGAGGGAPTVYPFEQLQIGQFFFVPKDAKNTDPVKKLQSTVSNANLKYCATQDGTKTIERTKRGEKNRAIVDPATGQKVKETVTIPNYKYTKEKGKFRISLVEAGKKYGDFTAPADGAVIARVPVTT